MSMIGRISSLSRFSSNKDNIIRNQTDFARHTQHLNTGKKLLNNYDTLTGGRDLVQVTGLIEKQNTLIKVQGKAKTELELAESALGNMKDILDQIKIDALQGASDTVSGEDLSVLGVQLRNLGENFYALANTKLGDKYLFGGLQSNLKVITHVPGSLFSNAIYKDGEDDIGERQVEGVQSSIGLGDLFDSSASTASYTGNALPNDPLTANAEVNLVINDGYEDWNLGDIALAAGDDGNTIASKINAAFNAAGGQGSIVSFNGTALEFDTANITGNIPNANAAIIISPGANDPDTLEDLGLISITHKGNSDNLREVFNRLDSAYNSNDTQSIREILVDLDENIDRLINAKAKLGDLVSKFDDSVNLNSQIKDNLVIDYTDISQIPVAEAIQKVSAAQATLNGSMQASALITQLSVFDFLNL